MVLKNIFRFSLSLAIVFTLFQGLVFAEISSSPVFDFVNKETNDFTGLDYKNVKPGDTISGTTQLILKSGNETDFYIKLVENDDSGKNIKVEDSIVSQSNLNITKSIVRLKEGDTKEINFSIKIPENTELGDHIALIVASYKSKENVNVYAQPFVVPVNLDVDFQIGANQRSGL